MMVQANGTCGMDRRQSMVRAAREYLIEQGYELDDHIQIKDRDAALARIIRLADDDWMLEALSERFVDNCKVLRDRLSDALEDHSNDLNLGSMLRIRLPMHFNHILQEAIESLPFDGQSDAEEWTDVDNTQRAEDLRASGF